MTVCRIALLAVAAVVVGVVGYDVVRNTDWVLYVLRNPQEL